MSPESELTPEILNKLGCYAFDANGLMKKVELDKATHMEMNLLGGNRVVIDLKKQEATVNHAVVVRNFKTLRQLSNLVLGLTDHELKYQS